MPEILALISKNWINFWVFIFCASVIGVSGHGGQAALVLLVSACYISVKNKNLYSSLNLHKNEYIFIILVVLFFIINLINIFIQPEYLQYENSRRVFRALDLPLRWLLFIPIYLLFRRYEINWKFWSIGLCVGVFISVGIAIYEVYFLKMPRALGGLSQPITFGGLMVVTDLILWTLMLHAWRNSHKYFSLVFFIASITAFYGSLLSVTRGALLAYLLMIFVWGIYAFKNKIFKISYFFSSVMVIRVFFAFIIFYAVSLTPQYSYMEHRIESTVSGISQGNLNKVSGGRFDIFATALKVNHYFPFGVGPDNFRAGSKAAIVLDALEHDNVSIKSNKDILLEKSDLLSVMSQYHYLNSYNPDGTKRYSARYGHAHNEWLNKLAETGYLGLLLLLLIFIFPIKIFWQNLNHENKLIGTYSFSGIMLIISFSIFSQTEAIFAHHASLIFFIFFLFLFISQIYKLNEESLDISN